MRSLLLPTVGNADLSDGPPREPSPPRGWPGHLVPNFSEWLPGDIILVESSGSPRDMAITIGQLLSFNSATRAGSAFVHAAVYVGGGEIVDITTGLGVAKRLIWPYCQTSALASRRVPNLTSSERDHIAAKASKFAMSGQPYSWWALTLSKLLPNTVPDPDHLYCSTLVGDMVDKGCGVQLHGPSQFRPLYPGTLAGHPALDPVELEWRPL